METVAGFARVDPPRRLNGAEVWALPRRRLLGLDGGPPFPPLQHAPAVSTSAPCPGEPPLDMYVGLEKAGKLSSAPGR